MTPTATAAATPVEASQTDVSAPSSRGSFLTFVSDMPEPPDSEPRNKVTAATTEGTSQPPLRSDPPSGMASRGSMGSRGSTVSGLGSDLVSGCSYSNDSRASPPRVRVPGAPPPAPGPTRDRETNLEKGNSILAGAASRLFAESSSPPRVRVLGAPPAPGPTRDRETKPREEKFDSSRGREPPVRRIIISRSCPCPWCLAGSRTDPRPRNEP